MVSQDWLVLNGNGSTQKCLDRGKAVEFMVTGIMSFWFPIIHMETTERNQVYRSDAMNVQTPGRGFCSLAETILMGRSQTRFVCSREPVKNIDAWVLYL